jgi:two-component system chemotaxis response regulator CheB
MRPASATESKPAPDDERPRRGRAVVLGASAGGVEALTRIVRDLPPSVPAPILIVLHVPSTAVSRLPEILRRAGALPAEHADHGDIPEPGRIYVAPPDRHLIVTGGRLVLVEGPRENGVRPAVDPLFRSAAAWYRSGLIAAILSGTMDDGTAGIATVHARGGVTVAQDPGDAIAPGMPTNAIENAPIDFVVAASEMPELFTDILKGNVRRTTSPGGVTTSTSDAIDLTCPECGGVLRQFAESGIVRFHCRVGHTYSPESLYAATDGKLEAALWAAIRTLEDSASLARRLADDARRRGSRLAADKFDARERDAAERADVVRSAILALGDIEDTPAAGEPPPVAADAADPAHAQASERIEEAAS